jgi:RNA polymerase sigma factor (sigma-70 family)
MAVAPDCVRKVFDRVRDTADTGGDGELLSRYRQHRDQDAFGSLVRRHGPMVLGVCNRVLRDSHAADDAFQATFLVLAKKADSVRPPDRLAPWLYGVAYRTAMKARGRAFRQQQVETRYATETANRTQAEPSDDADVLPILDEQLHALPEKYRTPLVLCALQGLNKAEAAERLGVPEGTVSSRLARARELLRTRLARRGVAVPALALASLLTASELQATVHASFAYATTEVALETALVPAPILSLSHEVLQSMMYTKLKAICVIALSVTLASGFSFYALNADDKKPAQGEKPAPAKPDDKEKPAPKKPDNKEGDKPKPKEGDKPKPKDGEKPRVMKSAGKVASVDTKEHSIMIAVKGDGGVVEKMYPVAKDAKIYIDGKEAKLDAIPKNATAGFLANAPKEGALPQITELRITGDIVTGLVAKADATSITLASEGNDKSFKLAANAKVTINGKEAKASDLKAGDKATLVKTSDNSAILVVTAGTKVGDGEKPGEKPGAKPDTPKNVGQLVAGVDANANTVSITVKGKETPIKLATNAKVFIDGKDAKLADIPKGAYVTFEGQKEGNKEVTVVRATGEVVANATVKQLDATSITITTPKTEKNPGTDRVLKLANIGKVTLNVKEAKVTELKPGTKVVAVLSADGASVLSIAASTPAKEGGDKPKPEKEENDE